jgi:type II secretory pathway component PulF
MTRNEGRALAVQWMERGATEHEVRDQLRRAGFDPGTVNQIVLEAYSSRLRLRGRKSTSFDRTQVLTFLAGAGFCLLAPLTGSPWTVFGGFNPLFFVLIGLGIGLMIVSVKLRPQV